MKWFVGLLCCLGFIQPVAGADMPGRAPHEVTYGVQDTTLRASNKTAEKEAPKSSKSTEAEKNGELKPVDLVGDVQQTVKEVPKAKKQVKPISVPSVKVPPPVKVNPPKIKTPKPIKIKL